MQQVSEVDAGVLSRWQRTQQLKSGMCITIAHRTYMIVRRKSVDANQIEFEAFALDTKSCCDITVRPNTNWAEAALEQ